LPMDGKLNTREKSTISAWPVDIVHEYEVYILFTDRRIYGYFPSHLPEIDEVLNNEIMVPPRNIS